MPMYLSDLYYHLEECLKALIQVTDRPFDLYKIRGSSCFASQEIVTSY